MKLYLLETFATIGVLLLFAHLDAQDTVTPVSTGRTNTGKPASIPTPSAPIRGKQECTKQPPNFREINLPCGGYDRTGCQNLCQKLKYPRFYCRKEQFCLCHSGDLYSC